MGVIFNSGLMAVHRRGVKTDLYSALMDNMLDADDMKSLMRIRLNQSLWLTIRIEQRILENIRRIIAANQSVEDGVELARKILELTVQATQESRRASV